MAGAWKDVELRLDKKKMGVSKRTHSESESESDFSAYDGDTDRSSPGSSPSSGRTSTSVTKSNVGLLRQELAAEGGRRRERRSLFYRLPQKVMRWLCAAMILSLLLFIAALFHASKMENLRLGQARMTTKPRAQVWESFPFLTRYYGGIRKLVPFSKEQVQYPKLRDDAPWEPLDGIEDTDVRAEDRDVSREKETPWSAKLSRDIPASRAFTTHPLSAVPQQTDEMVECFLDDGKTVRVPPIRYYQGRPDGFPNNVIGSYDLLSLPEDICFDRFGRYGPYGYGYTLHGGGLGVGNEGDVEGSESVWTDVKEVAWEGIDWADVQRRCYRGNAKRFVPMKDTALPPLGFYIDGRGQGDKRGNRDQTPFEAAKEGTEDEGPSVTSRTAVVLRCWDEFPWREDDIMNVRALISELNLASGGRYDVHLLVQVRDDAKHPIWADDDIYRRHINDTVPEEFRRLVTFWTVTQMLALYQGVHDVWARGPDLPVHGPYRGLQMAMQLFAHNHAEYDYFWQWEMDIRYIGHYLDLLSKLETFARGQARKGLWERNARFFLPHVHGSWEDFRQMTRVQTEHGRVGSDTSWHRLPDAGRDATEAGKADDSIWGPRRPADSSDWLDPDHDPVAPTTYERDGYEWGVGEEADLITLNPIFDPEHTTWALRDDMTGYNKTAGSPPRRAHIITASRLSRRLLVTMHRETALKKKHAFSEMWAATMALQHGLKAVFAPHPVYVDREWPTDYLVATLNGGRDGASGGARTSVFGDREHNMLGLTWFYNAGFSANLYRRWLGLRVNNDGGEDFEKTTDPSMDDKTPGTMRGGEGRMCMPPMLLHPIKDVDLPVEETAAEGEGEGDANRDASRNANRDAAILDAAA